MENLKDRVTIYEVAKASGVSLATVSRVINNQGNVTEETKQKVQKTISRLGYKPSGLAQALATNKSTTIGVVIPSANYVYISSVLNGITEIAKEKGFNLSLFITSHSRDDALKQLDKVITSHVDGAIIFDDELDENDIAKLNSYYVPTIVINNKVEGERVGCIVFAMERNFKGVLKEAIARNKGKKRLVFLHVHNCGRLLERTEKTFIKVCDEEKQEYRILNVDDSYTRTYNDFLGYFKTERHQKSYVVAYRDSIAAAITNAATDSGLKVPEDVEVLSIIGTKYANITRPTLSTMNINMQDVGRRAMYMLVDLSKNALENKVYRIEPEYKKRQSTEE